MSRTRVVRYGVQRGAVDCRFCGSSVVWAVTDSGRRMPIDRMPAVDGGWVLFYFEEEEPEPVQRVTWARSLEEYSGPRWLAHWATCPERDAARHQEETRNDRQLDLFAKGGL